MLGLELAVRIRQARPRVFDGDRRGRGPSVRHVHRCWVEIRPPDGCRRQRVWELNAGGRFHLGPELRMNRASLLAPKHAAAGVAPHHQDRGILAFVAVDRILRDHRKHLAVFVAERAHRMDVAAAKPVPDAIKPRAAAHQQRLPPRKNGHGLSKRGSEER